MRSVLAETEKSGLFARSAASLLDMSLIDWKLSKPQEKRKRVLMSNKQGILFRDCDMERDEAISVVRNYIRDAADLKTKVARLNEIKQAIHSVSPFKNEPVDCVLWIEKDDVVANDYNPNKVAPPEMELLEVSIMNDGYTQPIVTWPREDGKSEVVDGFHRSRVGRESAVVGRRVMGFLPTVAIRKEQQDKSDRIASTIRHNRARGKHQVDAMSEIVLELKNRNWTNARVAKELGMDEEEILRLCQITGLEHLFSDQDFSQAWEASDSIHSFEPIDDIGVNPEAVRTVNTSDPNRRFYTFDKWECHKAGFYKSTKDGMTAQQCREAYADFLRDGERFSDALQHVTKEWKHSCGHYLTNKSMNRIAWLGQAAVCYATGVPSVFCSGFNLLSDSEKEAANMIAFEWLNRWLVENGIPEVTVEEAISIGRQVEIY
jgi:ParB-like chromosome segregation protein Spo0J